MTWLLKVSHDHTSTPSSKEITITSSGPGRAQIIVESGRTPKFPEKRTTQTKMVLSACVMLSFEL